VESDLGRDFTFGATASAAAPLRKACSGGKDDTAFNAHSLANERLNSFSNFRREVSVSERCHDLIKPAAHRGNFPL
jgi:hypothetical protein